MKTIKELEQETREPVVFANQLGLITSINSAFEKTFGWSKEDLEGKPLTTIIPPVYHTQHHLGFSRFIVTGKSNILQQSLNLKISTKGGKIIEATHFIVGELIGGEWTFGALITI